MTNKIGIVAIALHEERYLDEWIQYHLALGFDQIYLCDNHPDNPLKPLEAKYPERLFILHQPGHAMQLPVYNHTLRQLEPVLKYVAYIDIDEFIVLKQHDTIQAFIRDHFQHRGALALSWVFYGSAGKHTYEPLPVTQRFTKRQRGVNHHVKCIVEIACAVAFPNPHYPNLKPGCVVLDPSGRHVKGPNTHYLGSDHIACLNHYWTKSREEFLEKLSRGRADIGVIRPFEEHDLLMHNELEDAVAWEFYKSWVLSN